MNFDLSHQGKCYLKSYDETLEKEYSEPKANLAAYWKTVLALSELVKQLLPIVFSVDSFLYLKKLEISQETRDVGAPVVALTLNQLNGNMKVNQEFWAARKILYAFNHLSAQYTHLCITHMHTLHTQTPCLCHITAFAALNFMATK